MNQKRQYTRLDYEADVELLVDDVAQEGRTVNVSQGGIFINTDPAPPFGTRLVLRMNLPGVPKICDLACIVRWSKQGDGIGLQFEQLRPIEMWALNKLVGTLQKS